MKKIVIMLLVLAFTSCEDALIEKPKSIADATFYNTKSEMESAVAAIYAPLRATNTYGQNYVSMQEVASDYQYGRGSWALLSTFQGVDVAKRAVTDGIWAELYRSIRNANIVIMKTPKGNQLSDSDKAFYIAEARFLRAFAYFILVRNWGGVPIKTEDNYATIEVGRNTADEVYQLILNDLKYAEENLTDNASAPGRASKWVAKTLLADVYFYRNMYNEAAGKIGEVVSANKYSLVPVKKVDDFYNIFGPAIVTTPEEVFYIKFSHENGCSYPMMIHHPGSKLCGGGGWYPIYTDKEKNSMIKNWNANDLRSGLWYNWDIGLGANTLLSKKFIDPTAPSATACGNDMPVYRYSEVLLMSAEANVRSTGNVSAADMEKLNMVHRRAYGYDPLVASPVDFQLSNYTKDSFLDLVIQERCYETATEGKRWIDLKRLGAVKLKQIIKANLGIDVADVHLLWPIPVAEFSYNTKLDPAKDENPGY